ncbi:MAG: UPF0158 family protein [Spirochaetia bacterium]|jgi:hypothetical protein|nr:UPF0158 family protein [Spirochaetia bacterium]
MSDNVSVKKPTMPLLTDMLLESIIFAMENQKQISFLDLEDGKVVAFDKNQAPLQKKGRYLALPGWGPADGFHLMELFASTVKNDIYARKLDQALHHGRGVFRKFKDVLRDQPLLEKQWYAFKDAKMKAVATNWYTRNQGTVSVVKLEEEFEELPDDLLIEDFSIEETIDDSLRPEFKKLKDSVLATLPRLDRLMVEKQIASFTETDKFYALTPERMLVGFLEYGYLASDVVELICYGVAAEFTDLGVFHLLFDRFSRTMARKGVSAIIIDFSTNGECLTRMFDDIKVLCDSRRLAISPASWNENRISTELLEV